MPIPPLVYAGAAALSYVMKLSADASTKKNRAKLLKSKALYEKSKDALNEYHQTYVAHIARADLLLKQKKSYPTE